MREKMRTLKTLVAFGSLLLVASSANATIVFDVSLGTDVGAGQEVDVSVTLTNVLTMDVVGFQFDWLLNGANVLAAARVAQPTGPAIDAASPPCDLSPTFQYQCVFPGGNPVATLNDTGDNWLWDTTPANMIDGTYALGRFTFLDGVTGNVSIGQCEMVDSNVNSVPCSSDSVALVPEPTTAALLGLGLFGLALGGRRR